MTKFNDFKSHGYEAVKELGANYAGGRITYLARKTDDQSLVVIKQFQFAKSGSTWDGHKAIERDIVVLKQLDHPNIPKYLTTFETPEGSCIDVSKNTGRKKIILSIPKQNLQICLKP